MRKSIRLGFLGLALALLASAGCSTDRCRINRETDQLRRDSDREIQRMEQEKPGAANPKDPATAGTVAHSPLPRAEETGSGTLTQASLPPQSTPDWVRDGKSSQYSNADFIVGIDSCQKGQQSEHTALATAEDRARSAIAKSIYVRIRSEFTNVAESVSEARGDKIVSQRSTASALDRIASQTDVALEGARVADRWYDRAQDTYWALAALDRASAGQTIMERMGQIQKDIVRDRELGAAYRKDGHALQAASYLNRAMKNSLALMAYRAQLRVIAPALAQTLPPVDDPALAPLWKESALATEELTIALVVSARNETNGATESSRVEAELARRLRELGLNVIEDKAAGAKGSVMADPSAKMNLEELRKQFAGRAAIVLVANFATKEIALQRMVNLTAYFYQSRADAVVTDLDTGRAVASCAFDLSGETHTGNPDPARAAEESILKGAQKVADQLCAELAAELNLIP